jgi:hypothetical protein
MHRVVVWAMSLHRSSCWYIFQGTALAINIRMYVKESESYVPHLLHGESTQFCPHFLGRYLFNVGSHDCRSADYALIHNAPSYK